MRHIVPIPLLRSMHGRLPRLADLSFAWKMGLLPGLSVLTLIGIVSVAALSLNHQAWLIDTVVQQDLTVALRLSSSATRLQHVDAELYRLVALQAASSRDQPVELEIETLLENIDQVLAELGRHAANGVSVDQAARIDAVAQALHTYRGAIEVVGSMLEVDFASAVAMVQPFDGNTRATLAALSGLADDALRDATARAQISALVARRTQQGFAAVAALVSVLVGCLAFAITRATVTSVGSIAAATVLIARGDRSVDVAGLTRRDELGAIVESLQAFGDNVARVAFLAHHDALTGLPNRVLFNDRLQSALNQLDRGRAFAVFCLDLDRFKAVNDTLGHPIGDLLLRGVADRVGACIREGDTLARLGGDEFAVIALDTSSNDDAGHLAERIVQTLSEAFELDGHTVCIGCSVGIALAPANGAFADKLLQSADTALYRAKTEGRNTHRFFEPGMDAQLQLRRELEIDMRRAISAQEFELHYQPLVNIKTMRISGFEALLRWRHHERGLIAPGAFIAVAEETGLMQVLGEFALMQACRDAVLWPDPIRVSVNLSPVQFKDQNLLATVLRALEASGLPPHRLELEITESLLLRQPEPTLAILHALRQHGVRLSMDDFGTGYSSLSYLSSFKFDKIKIDQSFVRDLCQSESAAAIVRAVTGLSGSLGVTTTAEGVETLEQFERLVFEGCTEVQGYLLGKPKPAGDAPLTLAAFGH